MERFKVLRLKWKIERFKVLRLDHNNRFSYKQKLKLKYLI